MKHRRILSFMLMIAMIMTMGVFTSMNVSAAGANVAKTADWTIESGDLVIEGLDAVAGTIATVKNGVSDLTTTTDYTFANNTLTIKSGYLTTARNWSGAIIVDNATMVLAVWGSEDTTASSYTITITAKPQAIFSGEIPSTVSLKTANFTYYNDTAGTLVSPATPTDLPVLNLVTEKLTVGTSANAFVIEGYAIGGKWKSGEPTDKDLATLFNKGGVLEITNKMSDKAKDGPHKGVKGKAPVAANGTVAAVPGEAGEPCGVIVKFAKIEARAKAPKLVADYILGADDTGKTYGKWTLSEKAKVGKEAYKDLANIEYVRPADNKKLAEEDKFVSFPTGGLDVLALGDGDKVGGKVLYFYQVKAYTTGTGTAAKYFPATKSVKLSVSAALKAPTMKPDYKSGTIKVKAGIAVSVASATDLTPAYTLYAKSAVAARKILAIPAKDKMPTLESMAYMSANAGNKNGITVFTYATDKKPASLKQFIEVAPTAAALTGDAGISWDGKKIVIPKELESKLKLTDAKWGNVKITPTASKSFTIYVRTKSVAKATKAEFDDVKKIAFTGYEGDRAGATQTVTITWGAKDADGNLPDPTIIVSAP